MKRVLVLVEGATEEALVHRLLKPHFWQHGKAIEPTRVCTRREAGRRAHRGGIATYAKVRHDLLVLLRSRPHAVTTLFDYYALPRDFPGVSTLPKGVSCFERAAHIERALQGDIGDPRLVANLVLHEVEGLLFSAPRVIAEVLLDDGRATDLTAIAGAYASPEEIDDGPETHPSRRIEALLPRYQKALHGPLIAERIGLGTLRAKCRHFDAWMTRIETL
jgi:hypothetical protein